MATFTLAQSKNTSINLLANANGSNIGLNKYPNTGESNYQDIDDPVLNPDNDSTYVYSTTTSVSRVTCEQYGNDYEVYDCCRISKPTATYIFSVVDKNIIGDTNRYLVAYSFDGTDLVEKDTEDLWARDTLTVCYGVDAISYVTSGVTYNVVGVCPTNGGAGEAGYFYTFNGGDTLTYRDKMGLSTGQQYYDIAFNERNGVLYAHACSLEDLAAAKTVDGVNWTDLTHTAINYRHNLAIFAQTHSTTTTYVWVGSPEPHLDIYTHDGNTYTNEVQSNPTKAINDINGDSTSSGTAFIAFADGYIGAYQFNGTSIIKLRYKKIDVDGDNVLGINLGCSGKIYARTQSHLYSLTFDGTDFTTNYKYTLPSYKKSTRRKGICGDSNTVYHIGANSRVCTEPCSLETFDYDLYEIEDWTHSTTGSINWIKVTGLVKCVDHVPAYTECYLLLQPDIYSEYSESKPLTNAYQEVRWAWYKRPDTLEDWEFTDIANLEIGIGMLCGDSTVTIRCTQLYATVNFTNTDYCYLNKPTTISTDHQRNIKMFNFWDGSREVYDLNRSGKTMVLEGTEFVSSSCTNPCQRIICTRNMGRAGNPITVSGLNPNYFNGEYRIRRFGWKRISEKPDVFDWIMELEDNEV